MPPDKLRVVAYTLPAWGGFMSAELIGKVDAMFRRLKRFSVSDLLQNA